MITLVALATYVLTCLAAELSAQSFQGEWIFTHIIMDGERDMRVNRKAEFLANGTAVNYDAALFRSIFKRTGGCRFNRYIQVLTKTHLPGFKILDLRSFTFDIVADAHNDGSLVTRGTALEEIGRAHV